MQEKVVTIEIGKWSCRKQ